ncbi:unnamed protein product, partial [Prorocentrum cordatum]
VREEPDAHGNMMKGQRGYIKQLNDDPSSSSKALSAAVFEAKTTVTEKKERGSKKISRRTFVLEKTFRDMYLNPRVSTYVEAFTKLEPTKKHIDDIVGTVDGFWVPGAFNVHLPNHWEYEDYEADATAITTTHDDGSVVLDKGQQARKFAALSQMHGADAEAAKSKMAKLTPADLLAIAQGSYARSAPACSAAKPPEDTAGRRLGGASDYDGGVKAENSWAGSSAVAAASVAVDLSNDGRFTRLKNGVVADIDAAKQEMDKLLDMTESEDIDIGTSTTYTKELLKSWAKVSGLWRAVVVKIDKSTNKGHLSAECDLAAKGQADAQACSHFLKVLTNSRSSSSEVCEAYAGAVSAGMQMNAALGSINWGEEVAQQIFVGNYAEAAQNLLRSSPIVAALRDLKSYGDDETEECAVRIVENTISKLIIKLKAKDLVPGKKVDTLNPFHILRSFVLELHKVSIQPDFLAASLVDDIHVLYHASAVDTMEDKSETVRVLESFEKARAPNRAVSRLTVICRPFRWGPNPTLNEGCSFRCTEGLRNDRGLEWVGGWARKAGPEQPSPIRVLLTEHASGKLLMDRANDILDMSEDAMREQAKISNAEKYVADAMSSVESGDRVAAKAALKSMTEAIQVVQASKVPAVKAKGDELVKLVETGAEDAGAEDIVGCMGRNLVKKAVLVAENHLLRLPDDDPDMKWGTGKWYRPENYDSSTLFEGHVGRETQAALQESDLFHYCVHLMLTHVVQNCPDGFDNADDDEKSRKVAMLNHVSASVALWEKCASTVTQGLRKMLLLPQEEAFPAGGQEVDDICRFFELYPLLKACAESFTTWTDSVQGALVTEIVSLCQGTAGGIRGQTLASAKKKCEDVISTKQEVLMTVLNAMTDLELLTSSGADASSTPNPFSMASRKEQSAAAERLSVGMNFLAKQLEAWTDEEGQSMPQAQSLGFQVGWLTDFCGRGKDACGSAGSRAVTHAAHEMTLVADKLEALANKSPDLTQQNTEDKFLSFMSSNGQSIVKQRGELDKLANQLMKVSKNVGVSLPDVGCAEQYTNAVELVKVSMGLLEIYTMLALLRNPAIRNPMETDLRKNLADWEGEPLLGSEPPPPAMGREGMGGEGGSAEGEGKEGGPRVKFLSRASRQDIVKTMSENEDLMQVEVFEARGSD